MSFTTKKICRAGIIAAIYVALTFITFPIASGAIQFRLSEALTLLPLFMPESIFGLFIGCIIANWVTGCTIFDIFLGSLITLIAAFITYVIGKFIKNNILKVILGGLPPIILNAVFLPLIWLIYSSLEYVYYMQLLFLLATEALSIYIFGTLLYFSLIKLIKKYPKIFVDMEKSKEKSNNTNIQEK